MEFHRLMLRPEIRKMTSTPPTPPIILPGREDALRSDGVKAKPYGAGRTPAAYPTCAPCERFSVQDGPD
jgi:hypothetical protein